MSTNTPADEIRDALGDLMPRLRRFARVITRNATDADDLVQAAVEKALERAAQWRPGSRLDAWLFGIMKNAWVDEIRARRRRARLPPPGAAAPAAGDADPHDRDLHLLVQGAVARLPEEQRLAVALVLIEGLPYRDAAETLGIPIGTLTGRLVRGRAMLLALLGDDGSPA